MSRYLLLHSKVEAERKLHAARLPVAQGWLVRGQHKPRCHDLGDLRAWSADGLHSNCVAGRVHVSDEKQFPGTLVIVVGLSFAQSVDDRAKTVTRKWRLVGLVELYVVVAETRLLLRCECAVRFVDGEAHRVDVPPPDVRTRPGFIESNSVLGALLGTGRRNIDAAGCRNGQTGCGKGQARSSWWVHCHPLQDAMLRRRTSTVNRGH